MSPSSKLTERRPRSSWKLPPVWIQVLMPIVSVLVATGLTALLWPPLGGQLPPTPLLFLAIFASTHLAGRNSGIWAISLCTIVIAPWYHIQSQIVSLPWYEPELRLIVFWMVCLPFPFLYHRTRRSEGEAERWLAAYETQLSALQEVSDRLETRNQELDDIVRRKDYFIGILAHELRGPCQAMRNAVEVIRLAPDDVERRSRSLAVIDRQLRQQLHLIEDLMELNRTRLGQIQLDRVPINLPGFLEKIAEDYRRSMDLASIDLRLVWDADPVIVPIDVTRMTQVLQNLLQNAVKFTDEGGEITVRIEQDPDPERVRIVIQDTGIGIAPHALGQIFQMFEQAAETRHRDRGGLGLGLALVRQFIELHGGTVHAESDGIGHGSRFVIALPRRTDEV